MSEVKPDCYCLGGDKAHYSEAKYQSLQRIYEQARDEALSRRVPLERRVGRQNVTTER